MSDSEKNPEQNKPGTNAGPDQPALGEAEEATDRSDLPEDDADEEAASPYDDIEEENYLTVEEAPEGLEEEAADAIPAETPAECQVLSVGPTVPARSEATVATGAPCPATRVAGVLLPDGKMMQFDARNLALKMGDHVVVDNERDLNLGRVVFLVPNIQGKVLRLVLRRVGPEDMLIVRRNQKREEEAYNLCQRRIAEHRLPMKLIQVIYLHGGNKAVFFFSADGRVDFRALVRDLAQELHVRIEMRQIGVRDEAKMLGGIGICGQPLCCSRYLRKFVPVSIKMAKNQGLALNPQKVSGLCGRLMCCLVYEDDCYRGLRKEFPKVGKSIDTPEGAGKVVDADVLGGKVRVQFEDRSTVFTLDDLKAWKAGEWKPPAAPAPVQPPVQPPAPPVLAGEIVPEPQQDREEGKEAGAETGAAGGPQAPRGVPGERRRRRRRGHRGGERRPAIAGAAPAPPGVQAAAPQGQEGQAPAGQRQAQPGQGPERHGRRRRGRRRRRGPGGGQTGGLPPAGAPGGGSAPPAGSGPQR